MIRHNEVRNLTACLLHRDANQVAIEPHLQPLSGKQLQFHSANADDQGCLDVVASGEDEVLHGVIVKSTRDGSAKPTDHKPAITEEDFKKLHDYFAASFRTDPLVLQFESTVIGVRVLNPYASSNRSRASSYTHHEKAKHQAYEQRTRQVEQASFVPAVFSTTGRMGRAASSLYKRMAHLYSEKYGEPYSTIMASIRCKLSFALIHSGIMCLRGSRRFGAPTESVALVVAETVISV